MVNENLVRDLFKHDPDGLEEAIRAFRFLQGSGVFKTFIDSGKAAILNSFGDEDEETLAKKIRELRQESRVLTTLTTLFNTTAQRNIGNA